MRWRTGGQVVKTEPELVAEEIENRARLIAEDIAPDGESWKDDTKTAFRDAARIMLTAGVNRGLARRTLEDVMLAIRDEFEV